VKFRFDHRAAPHFVLTAKRTLNRHLFGEFAMQRGVPTFGKAVKRNRDWRLTGRDEGQSRNVSGALKERGKRETVHVFSLFKQIPIEIDSSGMKILKCNVSND